MIEENTVILEISCFFITGQTSFSHKSALASLGIRQSPLGERHTLPTFTPSGIQFRLNCWVKKR